MAVFRDHLVVLLPELRAMARSMTRGDGPLADDDVVQDALVSALKCQHQFTPGTHPKAWLFTIVRNKFLSAVSRKHVTSEVHQEDLERHHWIAPEQESRIEVLGVQTRVRNAEPGPSRGADPGGGPRSALCRDRRALRL